MDATQPQCFRLAPADALKLLASRARAMAEAGKRTLLGIAGGPGVGKSTLAAALVEALNQDAAGFAALVPMDGFHMRQAKLVALGIDGDKGMPHTFEAEAFVTFLATLRNATGPVSGPGYSRSIEDVVENAFAVAPEVRLLVVEGNYLLLDTPPWDRIRPLLDTSAFLHAPREMVRHRLLARHAAGGHFTEARNRAHVERVDLGNYDLVERSRQRADIAIDLITES